MTPSSKKIRILHEQSRRNAVNETVGEYVMKGQCSVLILYMFYSVTTETETYVKESSFIRNVAVLSCSECEQ